MKRIKFFGQDGHNWSIDKDRKNLEFFVKKNLDLKITDSYIFSDIYFFVWYSQIIKKINFYKILNKFLRKKIIAVATNDIREYKENFKKLKNFVNLWVSPNSKISAFFKKEGVNFFQLPFYVSPNIFYPISKSKKEIADLLGIDYDKIKEKKLIGSFQRDSLASDLSKGKWQKGPKILFDIVKELGDDYLLVIAGPRRHYLVNLCREKKVNYLFVGDESYIDRMEDDFNENNLQENKINLLYNLIDCYIVSSLSEGGPKAILESCLTKTFVVSTDVGLAKDFLHEDLIYDENKIDNIKNKISSIYEQKRDLYIQKNKKRALDILNEENYLEKIKELFKKILQS